VARQLLNRDEYRAALVRSTFVKYLNRQPDNGELEFWRQRVGQNDFTTPTQDERFEAEVLASREALLNTGDSGPAWVSRLYTGQLGRTPAADEFTYWYDRLLTGYALTRQEVIRGFTEGDEYRARLIETTIQQLLGRPALPSDVPAFRSTRTEVMRAIIVASDEYFQQQGGTNQAWLDRVYLDLLGRARGTDGQADLDALNNMTKTRRQVADELVAGDEYRRRIVGGFFMTFLNRPATADELRVGLERLASGFTEERMLADILNSTEYFLSANRSAGGG
jgi:hypothetical protein